MLYWTCKAGRHASASATIERMKGGRRKEICQLGGYAVYVYAGWDGTFFFSFFTLENSFLGSFFNFPVVLLVLEWRWWMSFWTWNGTGSSLPRHGGLID